MACKCVIEGPDIEHIEKLERIDQLWEEYWIDKEIDNDKRIAVAVKGCQCPPLESVIKNFKREARRYV